MWRDGLGDLVPELKRGGIETLVGAFPFLARLDLQVPAHDGTLRQRQAFGYSQAVLKQQGEEQLVAIRRCGCDEIVNAADVDQWRAKALGAANKAGSKLEAA
jgi:hypothetical protein